jgi:hypothetical protein
LAKNAYLASGKNNPVGNLESVLQKVVAAENLEARLYQAVHDKKIAGYTYEQKIQDALQKKIISNEEAQQLLETYNARREALAVDDFSPSELECKFEGDTLYRKILPTEDFLLRS